MLVVVVLLILVAAVYVGCVLYDIKIKCIGLRK
jgi:hypothetical protein